MSVDVILPLDQMTVAEKLRAMEAIWADLTRDEEEIDSPAWHADVLKEREMRVSEGKESYMDWEEAKKQLRDLHK